MQVTRTTDAQRAQFQTPPTGASAQHAQHAISSPMHLARPTTPIGPAAANGHDGVAGESAGAAFTGVSCKALLLVLFEAELSKKRMSCTALLNCTLVLVVVFGCARKPV